MIRPRTWTVGKREEFAISLSISEDPDLGRGASVAYSATWGSFEIWVNGLNLCQHREGNISLDSVHWYLLPMLRWFVSNWDALLHEERLPNRNEGRDAWSSFRDTIEPPLSLNETQADDWEESHQAWWNRHCLLACREGGLFPNLFIRRMRNDIEFSWGPTDISGAPLHYQFFANHGFARIDVTTVSDNLFDVVGEAIQHLHDEKPSVSEYAELWNDYNALRGADRFPKRMGLLLSQPKHDNDLLKPTSDTVSSFFDLDQTSELVIREAPQVCLMFGSVSPSINDCDIDQLLKLIRTGGTNSSEALRLKSFVRDQPIRSSLERPWKKGYELAEKLHEALSEKYIQPPVKIEDLLDEFGIQILEVELEDRSIRAIALAGSGCSPTIALNTNYEFQSLYPRRFILAHELCHLLHDRTHGIQLALASGPWAPLDIEKRANAFAAMFLMPSTLIEDVVKDKDLNLESPDDLRILGSYLQVSFSSAVEHVCNLGYISHEQRDSIKDQLLQ